MSTWAPSISCPFMRRLIVVLSEEEPAPQSQQDGLLFTRLLELEMDAERRGASEASCRVIGRVRRIAGLAVMKAHPPAFGGNGEREGPREP